MIDPGNKKDHCIPVVPRMEAPGFDKHPHGHIGFPQEHHLEMIPACSIVCKRIRDAPYPIREGHDHAAHARRARVNEGAHDHAHGGAGGKAPRSGSERLVARYDVGGDGALDGQEVAALWADLGPWRAGVCAPAPAARRAAATRAPHLLPHLLPQCMVGNRKNWVPARTRLLSLS